MTALHSVPGHIDEAHRATEPIPVLQVVDHDQDDYDVRLDVSGHVDLIALAKAIWSDSVANAEWFILMFNEGTGPRRVMAAAELRRIPAIRAALTIAIDPAEAGNAADSLAERLEQAALEPARCEYDLNFEGCQRFTVGDEDYCEEHAADVAEHGLPGDRGSYDHSDDYDYGPSKYGDDAS